MVLRVTLIAMLIAMDPVAIATIAISPAIWHAIVLVPVLGPALAAATTAVSPVIWHAIALLMSTATTVISLDIWHAIVLVPVMCPALANATAAISLVIWHAIALVPVLSPAVAMDLEHVYGLCLGLL